MACPVKQLDTRSADFDRQLTALTAFDLTESPEVEATVKHVIDQVREQGDSAVLAMTQRFDRVAAQSIAELEISQQQLQQALHSISAQEREALQSAAQRIRTFHEKQTSTDWQYTEADGTILGQRVTPLDSVGVYVPGGLAAYPSSLLMDVIPAKVAGVGKIVMVSPTPDDVHRPIVLAAAAIAGVDRVFRIGGAQAVAALAYGTQTIPAVDKIIGPGNAYVAAAKRRVFGVVGIDMIAGPSEILVIADGSTPADWVAMDLFSQAEHDEVAQSILLCPDAAYLTQVQQAINVLIDAQPRHEIIRKSLAHRGALIHTRSLEEACEISNRIAPEHMELSVADPQALLPLIKHAGAIFMGAYSSETLGDYTAGPNHVLPTARTARFSSPLGVYDFQKRSSIIFASKQGAQTMGRVAVTLAQAEGLHAHAQAAQMRIGADV